MKKLLTALIVLALVLLCSGALADIIIDGTFTDPDLEFEYQEWIKRKPADDHHSSAGIPNRKTKGDALYA